MPSYLDFNSTSQFRDSIIARTLQSPDGPQSFTSGNYSVQNLTDFANVDPGDVETNRDTYLQIPASRNTFTVEEFDIIENLRDIARIDNLGNYPYFTGGNPYSLIGIMTTDQYDNESKMMNFAARYIKNDKQGPVLARITQNLVAATYGRVRLIDALEGNTATAINIITGKEDLIEKNYKITVAKTLPGKAIDFLQTVAGVEFPWSEIPGDYLTDPNNPTEYRPQAQTGAGSLFQDITGALGSLIGIQRRPKLGRKPSDLMIEYMGGGQKAVLYDNLRLSKYAPNYTTTARSQNSSKLFNFVDNIAQGINTLLGNEAPRGLAYIGDDRGEDVKYAMSDFNDNVVRSNYYLSLMFDPIQTELFERKVNVTEGGPIGGKLTWYSTRSKNKLGTHNEEYSSERSRLEESLSTKYGFREDSLMGKTQELLNSMPQNGGESRSHVANAIDQTSRVFREGNVMLSRGSAIKYVDKFSGEESGVEYCRVWTKDRSYMNMSDTMKRTGNIRKFDSSVMSTPWNLNIAPMSNGKSGDGAFAGSTNIFKNENGDGFYAKKYMFSIENLAWKTSNTPGYTVSDLPYCERGPNGGRVMWFPPYDLKMSEQNSASWEDNIFLGRPEPIYTYKNTQRTGQISFKVVVDHPSVLNLLVREHFKGMSDEEADNYINAFFAGCEDIDFYSLIRRYSTVDSDDIKKIQDYLNAGKPKTTDDIKKYKTVVEDVEPVEPKPEPEKPAPEKFEAIVYFPNDFPKKFESTQMQSQDPYEDIYNQYVSNIGDVVSPANGTYMKDLEIGLNNLFQGTQTNAKKNDKEVLFGTTDIPNQAEAIDRQKTLVLEGFDKLTEKYNIFTTRLDELKKSIEEKKVSDITISFASSTSSVADNEYNSRLSVRRSHSITQDILKKLSKGSTYSVKWTSSTTSNSQGVVDFVYEYTFKELGYDDIEGKLTLKSRNYGENIGDLKTGGTDNLDCHNKNILSSDSLKRTAPITFFCRHTEIDFEVQKLPEKNTDSVPDPNIPKVRLEPDGTYSTPTAPKPQIDELKRIIVKTLSECYYFKKLEEDSPVAFSSLREKLRYFHPGFHSTTPEGLNSRLTFLLQCLRPGDTVPIKGVGSEDQPARNTTFGPPPICVIRVGDFYHSKIVIRDINITFDDATWDLNPEGIGVQPMIANVSLQVNFIGGQGMEKTVERLQNALSSNFYANTEMYDPRSISTNTTIGGVDAAKFTKEMLEDFVKPGSNSNPQPGDSVTPDNEIKQGVYIGTPSADATVDTALGPIPTQISLSYDEIINRFLTNTKNYFVDYTTTYDDVLVKYGPDLHSLMFSNNYRTVNELDVNTSDTATKTINLLGEYKPTKPLNRYLSELKSQMVAAIRTEDISTLFKFDKFLPADKLERSNTFVRPEIERIVISKIDEFELTTSVKTLEGKRNEIIKDLDSLNYLVKYVSDGSIIDTTYTKGVLSGYTYESVYKEYDQCIDYIEKNNPKFQNDIDTTIDFNSLNIDILTLELLLRTTLKDDVENIVKIYEKDVDLFPENIRKKIQDKLEKFVITTKKENIKTSRFKDRKGTEPIKFTISTTEEITDTTQKETLDKVHSTKIELGDKLNFYKP